MSIAAEWNELYNRFYRKQEVYQMCWHDVDLSKHIVACERFGGPIAIIRDETRLLLLGTESTRPQVRIFTASGMALASFMWDKGRIVRMGWTDTEVLLCVVETGVVYQHNIRGEALSSFSMGKEASDQLIVDCVIWGRGLVVLTGSYHLYAVSDLVDPRPVRLASPSLAERPHCMAVVEPQFTVSGNLEVLLAVGRSVVEVDAGRAHDLNVQIGPIVRIAVSPNGSFLACFTKDGRVLVLSTDCSRSLSEFATKSESVPQQVAWCGVDSVVVYWREEDTLLMVGPFGDSVSYAFDDKLVLVPEVDGLRILTSSTMELLQCVPDSTVSIFRIGSTAPGALLLDALEHFDRRSAKADENLRAIGKDSLPDAVEACIDAASHEFDLQMQRTLLRAAAYGRVFCSKFSKDRFQTVCKELRVLNAVRHYETGIPLTLNQLHTVTLSVLLNRLTNAHRYLLALRISEWMSMGKEDVLRHWACAKIATTPKAPDSAVLETLVGKLRTCKGVSYARIAEYAQQQGRTRLAAMLLDYEPRAGEQVPLLMSMGEVDRALVKAVESGDTDLIYVAMFHMQRTLPEKDVFRLVQSRPPARDLFIKWARETDHELLKKFYFATGNPAAAGEVLVRESYAAAHDRVGRGSALTLPRIKILDQAAELYAQNKENGFQAKAAEEAAKLLKVQQELEISAGQPMFVDLSVSDTIKTCVSIGNHRGAQRLRTDFKVPDRRFYWIKVQALAAAKDWEGLDKFSRERKPPIGYGPFVDACIDNGNNAEAVKYVPKLADLHARAEAYAGLGMVSEAAEAAAQAKDGELLGRLRSTFASNSSAAALIDALKEKLSLAS